MNTIARGDHCEDLLAYEVESRPDGFFARIKNTEEWSGPFLDYEAAEAFIHKEIKHIAVAQVLAGLGLH